MTQAGLQTTVMVERHRLGVSFGVLKDLLLAMLRKKLSLLLKLGFGFLQDVFVAVARRSNTLLVGFGFGLL